MKKSKYLKMIKDIARLSAQGYQVKLFDNVPQLRYDWSCWKIVKGKMTKCLRFRVRYGDFPRMIEEMDPEVYYNQYVPLNKKISELNRELCNLLTGILNKQMLPKK